MTDGRITVSTANPLPMEELRLGYSLWRAEEFMDAGGRGVEFSVSLPVVLEFRFAQDGHLTGGQCAKRQFKGRYEGLLVSLGRSRDQSGSGRQFWTAAIKFEDDGTIYNFDYRIFKQARRHSGS